MLPEDGVGLLALFIIFHNLFLYAAPESTFFLHSNSSHITVLRKARRTTETMKIPYSVCPESYLEGFEKVPSNLSYF